MAFDAKEVSDKKTAGKNPVRAYMEWELCNSDGTPLLKEDGTPILKSDKDIALWGKKGQYPSKADEQLILGAQAKDEDGEYLEVTMKVKIKAYTPKEEMSTDDLFKALGIVKAA